MAQGDELFSQCEQVLTAPSREVIYQHLAQFAKQHEFAQFLYTAVPNIESSTPSNTVPAFITSFDQQWMEHYREQRYDQNDSALRHCHSGTDRPYIWPGSKQIHTLPTKARKVYCEAGEAGIINGFTLPLPDSLNGTGVLSFSFAGSERDFQRVYQAKKNDIALFAYCLNQAIFKHSLPQFNQTMQNLLTPKEHEVLRWLASGLTYDEISDQLTIGVSTVRKHVSSIIRKLNARNATAACAIALRWGLI